MNEYELDGDEQKILSEIVSERRLFWWGWFWFCQALHPPILKTEWQPLPPFNQPELSTFIGTIKSFTGEIEENSKAELLVKPKVTLVLFWSNF